MTVLWVILGYILVAAVAGKISYMMDREAEEQECERTGFAPLNGSLAPNTLLGLLWPIALGVIIFALARKFWDWWFNYGFQRYYRSVKRRRLERTNWIDGN